MTKSANRLIIAILGALCVFMIAVLTFIFTGQGFTAEKQQVAASIFPLYDIVRRIAGNEIEVVCILPPGASPHTFDPTPQEVKKAVGSSALFIIGHGLDNWSVTFAKSADISHIVTVDQHIDLIDSVKEHEAGGHTSFDDGSDPHYWLSVPNAIGIASQVRDELISIYPGKAATFKANFNAYQSVLIELQGDIDSQLGQLPTRKISTFHKAWSYFARDHHLDIVTTFEEYPGEEPTSGYLKEFQEKIKQQNVRVIFSEPQFSTAPLLAIADDLGVKVSVLDPIGGVPGRQSYEELMRFNLQQIRTVLQ